MNLTRQAMLQEPDIRFHCSERGVDLRESFIGTQLLWQFSTGKKVHVRYWPATETAAIAQFRVGEEFSWTSTRCSLWRAVQYAIDNAPRVRSWVDARKMQSDGRDGKHVGIQDDSTPGVDGVQEPRTDGTA